MLCISSELENDSLLKKYNLEYGQTSIAKDD
jgi:hypothetical protein